MYGYEIPVTENAYAARSRYLNDKKQQDEMMKAKREYTEFINDSKDYFLSESINMILQNSLDENTSAENREYGKALVEGFVRETGSDKLINDFSRKSLLLAGISQLVKESHQKVIHGCADGDKKTFKISKTINDEFFEKLIGLDDEKITAKINERVCDSIEDFVQANVNDRLDLEELAEKTKEKIEYIKARNSEEKAKIEESYNLQYQRQVQQIKNRTNRKVGVYEQIMHSMTHGIVSDNAILESFTTSEGKLDMEKITGKVNVLYTFLEMLNTTKMVNVNETFIESVLKDIK